MILSKQSLHEKLIYNMDFLKEKKKGWLFYKTKNGAEFQFRFIDNHEIMEIFIKPTNEVKDWKVNFYASSIDIGVGRVHKGYYNEVKEFLLFLKNNQFNIENICEFRIFGYSYGGGCTKVFVPCLRTILAFEYKIHPFIIGFSNEGCKSINERTSNFISFETKTNLITICNSNDIVTKIPYNFVSGGIVINIGKKRKWWKTDIKIFPFFYNKKKSGIYKFFTVTSHEYDDFFNNLDEYIKNM